jgi:hypothetical protein
MYINRSMLMILAIALVFFPTAQSWINQGPEVWYRPYLLWALVILLAYLNQRWWQGRR